MRLSKVITPELIMGTRDLKDYAIWYRTALKSIEQVGNVQPDQGGIYADTDFLQSMNPIAINHFAMAWKYRHQGGKVYQVGREFAQALSEVSDSIPIDRLPEKFFGYFSFADGTFDDGGENVRGGFVFVGPAHDTSVKGMTSEKVVWISYDCDPSDPKQEFFSTAKLLLKIEGEDLSDAIETSARSKGSTIAPDKQVFRTLLNLAIYVHSSDPVLLPTRPVQDTTISQRKKFFQAHQATNLCTVPVTFVSWNFKRPKSYSMDHTTVSGHFRWQRHGAGFQEVKLIWIDEHERKFHKADDATHPQPSNS